MLTKIFHPNVSSAGEICVNTLKKDWKPTYGIEHILTTIKCLLIYPNAESALDEEAGKLLLEGYDEFCSRARLITSVHARGAVRLQLHQLNLRDQRRQSRLRHLRHPYLSSRSRWHPQHLHPA
jgi:hypothetical protein